MGGIPEAVLEELDELEAKELCDDSLGSHIVYHPEEYPCWPLQSQSALSGQKQLPPVLLYAGIQTGPLWLLALDEFELFPELRELDEPPAGHTVVVVVLTVQSAPEGQFAPVRKGPGTVKQPLSGSRGNPAASGSRHSPVKQSCVGEQHVVPQGIELRRGQAV